MSDVCFVNYTKTLIGFIIISIEVYVVSFSTLKTSWDSISAFVSPGSSSALEQFRHLQLYIVDWI